MPEYRVCAKKFTNQKSPLIVVAENLALFIPQNEKYFIFVECDIIPPTCIGTKKHI